MNKSLTKLAGSFVTILIMIVAVLAVLMVFGVISFDTLKESSAKLAGAFAILVVSAGLVALIQNKHS